ncbi:type VI secretion system secreted protein VgrG [Janthinobacterium sp. CG_23.3]|uniref:type VI secretion system Vgr family protein n=1 Tax=Janthinobacterium sp. CG_23.3 TaxID=3349634 RepID=UPI0038D4F5B0
MTPNRLSGLAAPAGLSGVNRPIRLRLWAKGGARDDLLLVKRVGGVETICGGIEYRLLCVAETAGMPLKQFIAMPAELQFVTDTGKLRSVCGIVDAAVEGEADAGLATYQLVVRDGLAVMDKGGNSRIFRNKSEVEITEIILGEWRRDNPVLARAFDFQTWRLKSHYPQREFTMQYNESDAAFLRRLWKRRGLAWFIQPGKATAAGDDDTPGHTLVLFDDAMSLEQNAAGGVRYHRDDGTEARDSVTAWHGARALAPGSVTRQSWDYKTARSRHARVRGGTDQGELGNELAAGLDDGLVDAPHAGADEADYDALAELRMQGHEFIAKCFRAESGVRDLCVGQWNALEGHAEIDAHQAAEREFVVTELRVEAENNLPKALNDRVQRLFALNRWDAGAGTDAARAALAGAGDERGSRYTNQFSCVRRGVPIVPAYDPRVDLPRTASLNVVVVGPPGESVHCDEQGRVKVRFPGFRPDERAGSPATAEGVTEHDSAWLRVNASWAGARFGAISLPRVGTMCRVSFLGNDPDKPVITSAVHGGTTPPPSFSHVSRLPGDRYLSGIVSQEIGGARSNQLRFDDSPGQISIQIASEHRASELNLGYLTHPRRDGQAKARGDGFELRTDDSGSIRTAKSLLISAWKRLDAAGGQLSNDEHVALMQDCLDLFKSLGQYAAEHQALAQDPAPQAELKDDVGAAAGGGNTKPREPGGKPTLSLTAPAGIAVSTPKTIVSYAGVNVDTVAQRHLQFTSGQRCNVNAGKGISLFAHHDGITQIAHYGKFLMQSQHDELQIDSAKDVKITAAKRLIGMAHDELTLMTSGGAYLKLSGGNVELGGPGSLTVKTNGHNWNGPASAKTELPSFGEGELSRTPRLLRATDGQPVEGMKLHLERDGEAAASGLSNAAGEGTKIVSDRLQQLKAFFFETPP